MTTQPAAQTRTAAETAQAPTAETIHRFLTRFGAGDRPGMLDLFGDQVDFLVAGDEDRVPWAGRRSSRTEVDAFLRSVLEDVQTETFVVEHTVVSGANGVLLGRFEHRVRRTGKVFAGAFALHIGVTAGQITTYHMFEDSHRASLAFTAD